MTWKKITVPKPVYLPTGKPDGAFKNTGLRVEPTDQIEIQPGSNLLQVNGVEHQLLISTDALRIDPQGTLILDTPRPPVGSLTSGDGRSSAFVGRVGTAHSRRRPPNAPDQPWIPQDEFDPQIPFAESEEFAAFETAIKEQKLTRTVTLKDGTTAEVLVDPTTGRIATGPFRIYSGVGINSNTKETARTPAEQTRNTRVASTGTPPDPKPPAPVSPGCPSGLGPHLDGFLQATLGSQGFPLGKITYLQVEHALCEMIMARMNLSQAATLEAVFARIHLCGDGTTGRPGVLVRLIDQEGPSDQVRLELAEQLPVLISVVKNHGLIAVVILSLPWGNKTPTLLTHLTAAHLTIRTHVPDPRFLTASTGTQTITFPKE